MWRALFGVAATLERLKEMRFEGLKRRPSEEFMKRYTPPDPVELVAAPAAIERALQVYEQLQPRDASVLSQARKILTQHVYGMVDRGEQDERRLIVGGLAHLKAVERDHEIRSAHILSEKIAEKSGKNKDI